MNQYENNTVPLVLVSDLLTVRVLLVLALVE